jgi:ABC-type uncharacterized transport system auxiliary subunit
MKKSIFYILGLAFVLAACGGAFRSEDNTTYTEETEEYMTEKNDFANIDSYKPKTMAEREEMSNRWNTARKETRWQDYKGTMVRVEILLGYTDVREMRLRVMQNANGADVDGDMRTVLAKVADYEMKRVCGRNVESIVMVYDRPSTEVMRPTSFYDYRVESEGAAMREYGFRCVYND